MPTPTGIGASAMPLRWPRALLTRLSAHVPRQLRRIGAKLAEWDRAEGEDGTATRGRQADFPVTLDKLQPGLP